jgi:hypothetical protein
MRMRQKGWQAGEEVLLNPRLFRPGIRVAR